MGVTESEGEAGPADGRKDTLTVRHALVTGAGRGIGAAIVRLLSYHGARVTLAGRTMEVLEGTAKGLGTASCITAMDVTDPASIEAAVGMAEAELGPVDILVNNAGAADSAPFHRLDMDHWRRMLDVNLTGVYACTRAVLPGMTKRGFGRVVNVASTAGLKGYPYVAAYCAAKHGVVGLTRALAVETARTGVTVNAVCPGYTDTDLVTESVARIRAKTGRSETEILADLCSSNPQGRLVSPGEVANAVAWLCLPGSESVTGQAIAVAGGEVM
ncbi:MAG TPA: SDR family NAD(P)-dependent oxidoreductase [Alphaproteobacteria bacterium]|nr:SDR family NAD(P)-dependent oxidoreductase [Alphaproteobacteria bacterium]